MERLETVEEIVEEYSVSSSPSKSRLYTILGSLFVVFAIIGIWIPGWPTVSWAVPAAYFFSISSERLFRWTLTNDYFGPAIFRVLRNWEDNSQARQVWGRLTDWDNECHICILRLGGIDQRDRFSRGSFFVGWG